MERACGTCGKVFRFPACRAATARYCSLSCSSRSQNPNREWRKHEEDWEDPPVVEPLTTAGPQPWHADALYWRYTEGLTVRECAKKCGVGFSPMQRFLNPESKRKGKVRQARIEREKRHEDPAYMKKRRDYSRRYAQFIAPSRWKND